MKIILVIKHASKSILCITDQLEYLSLPQIVKKIKNGELKNFHLTKVNGQNYPRPDRSKSSKDNLSSKTITLHNFIEEIKTGVSKLSSIYVKFDGKYLETQYSKRDLLFLMVLLESLRKSFSRNFSL